MTQNERKPRRRSEQPISRLFPNMITIAGLCCGLSAVRFAFDGKWEMAVGFVLAAALIDGMDGRVARMLGATSTFGAQLDSLSDFLCFGVSPPLVLFMWQLHEIKRFGWAVVLFFAVCMALRLARFNTALIDDTKQDWEKQFFTGVPAPAGGMLSLLPLILSLRADQEWAPAPLVTACYALVVAFLMASRIPTFAGKHIRIKHEWIPYFMIGGTIMLVALINDIWLFLSLMSVAYLASIFFSVRKYRALKDAQIAPEDIEID